MYFLSLGMIVASFASVDFLVSSMTCMIVESALASPQAAIYKNSTFQERNMLWSDPATHTESPKKSEVPSGNLT